MRVAVLLIFGLLYAAGYLGLASRWWFSDDTSQFAYTADIPSSLAVFTDPKVLRGFGTGEALVPMQFLSYRIDVNLAGFSPHFAYAHQIASFLLTLVLLYLLLVRWLGGNKTAALAASLCWALLPATAVVVQFLATRHYLEGLLFTALAVYLAERLRGKGVVALCGLVAMLYKEVFVFVVPLLLLGLAWRRKDRLLGALSVLLGLIYLLYRLWAYDLTARYAGMPLLSPWHYLKFLSKLPYTLSANYGGYLLVAFGLAACVLVLRRGWGDRRVFLFFAALVVVSLAALFPVTNALYFFIRRPDSWYRILFVLHTIVVVFAAWAATRLPWRWAHVGLAAASLLIVAPGVVKTRNLWAEMTANAEREAMFYLGNPDKVLLSEQNDWWFVPGIDWMYKTKPHYVLRKDLATARIEPGTPVWAWRSGRFRPICTSSAESGSLGGCLL